MEGDENTFHYVHERCREFIQQAHGVRFTFEKVSE